MTNKKKRKAKSISAKTGMSHAAAMNQLNKSNPKKAKSSWEKATNPEDPDIQQKDRELIEALGEPAKELPILDAALWDNGLAKELEVYSEQYPRGAEILFPQDGGWRKYLEPLDPKKSVNKRPSKEWDGLIERSLVGQEGIPMALKTGQVSPRTRGYKPAARIAARHGLGINYTDFFWAPLDEINQWKGFKFRMESDNWSRGGRGDPTPRQGFPYLCVSDLLRVIEGLPLQLELVFFTTRSPDEKGLVKWRALALTEGRLADKEQQPLPEWLHKLHKEATERVNGRWY